MLNLQLAVLRHEPRFSNLRDQVMDIAEMLEEQANIPMVREQLVLLEEIQSEEWWQDVTVVMLEQVRKKLRVLVQFIEKRRRNLLYTDFEDEMGRDVVRSSRDHAARTWSASGPRPGPSSRATKTTSPFTGCG